jgi:magnesium transporter
VSGLEKMGGGNWGTFFSNSVTFLSSKKHSILQLSLLAELGEIFGIHPLVLEDVLNPSQRIKLEQYDDFVFILLKMITYSDESKSFDKENVSLILGKQFLNAFQEKPGDVFEVIRHRIRNEESRMRQSTCDYLAYRLIDSIVDHYYIVLEKYGERIEQLEIELSKKSDSPMLNEIQVLKRELLLFLRAVMPLSEVLSDMMKEHLEMIADDTRVFLSDVYDHFVYIKDTIISFRELDDSIHDGYMSMISFKMNEVMQVLTIFAAIFIPLTFIAGV